MYQEEEKTKRILAEIEKVMKIKKHFSDQEPGPYIAPLK